MDSRGQPTFEPSTEVAIKTSAKQDVYVVLAGIGPDETAEIRVTFNPLVVWVWIGGGLMLVGGLIVMWPQVTRRSREGGYGVVLKSETVEHHAPAGV